jgi:LDH2 family malate/lactate/ureidoglycolate dehydrogenase
MPKNTEIRISFQDLSQFCKNAYVGVGVPDEEASIVSSLLARSDLRGVASHGVMRLPIYIERLEKNYVRKVCQFELLRKKGATAYVTANGSMGHLVSYKSMQLAIELAQKHGIGWVTVKDSGHFGVTGLFPMMALEEAMIGYVCSNSAPMMAPFGGKKRIIGNNPLSYAFPTDKYTPVVVDFSCSVVASGRLILARKKGESIPLGWAIDQNGRPTTDPFEGYEGGGSLLAMGEHKGYGLALAHEIMSSILGGGKWTINIKSLYETDESGIQGTCHSFMVVDPDCFVGRREFKECMDNYIEAIKRSGPANGIKEILMPGEIEARTEENYLKDGIPIAGPTVDELIKLAMGLRLRHPFG